MTPAAAWMSSANLVLAHDLWHEGVSASEIGRRLGCTKNSVLSYAHRCGWAPRPSPIGRRKGEVVQPLLQRAPDALRAACRPEPLAVPTAVFRSCQWPTTSQRPWRFCGCPTVRGAWCEDHRRVVYGPIPRRAA